MDIFTVTKCFEETWILRKMCKDSQFDLRVVRREKLPAVCEIGNERLSNLSAKLCPNRNVLYVRIVA